MIKRYRIIKNIDSPLWNEPDMNYLHNSIISLDEELLKKEFISIPRKDKSHGAVWDISPSWLVELPLLKPNLYTSL